MKKLTQDNRADIIRRLQAGETQKTLADEYDVSQSTINRVRSQSIKASRSAGDDPFPALTTETLQQRYSARYGRLVEVATLRQQFIDRSTTRLEQQIDECKRDSRKATTSKMAEAYKNRANSYLLEMFALTDLSEFEDEIADLLSELSALAESLIKVRKKGIGTSVSPKEE